MKTIILQSEDTLDLRLILDLVKRLGIQYVETEKELDVEDLVSSQSEISLSDDEQILDTSALYEGLGLDENIITVKYQDLNEELDPSILTDYNSSELFNALQEVGGAWEEDDSETLEELLNMLTP